MRETYLIIKISAIGDVIMAMPMVNTIRENHPDSGITWVCGKTVYPLLKGLSIDRLVVVDENKLLRGTWWEKFYEVLRIWKVIGGHRYDHIAVGHADKRYRLLTILTRGAEKHFSHDIGNMNPIPGRHHTDEYLRLLGGEVAKEKITAPVRMRRRLPDWVRGLLSERKRKVVFAPGGAKNLLADDEGRRWPTENYVELSGFLLARGYQVILCGGKTDEWVSPYFEGLPVVDLIGKTNLLELLALFDSVDVVVTHDSGPMHLAGMTKCRLISLFGPTNPFEKWPRREGSTFLWDREKYSCCPCYDGKCYAHCRDYACIRGITPERVLKEILREPEGEK